MNTINKDLVRDLVTDSADIVRSMGRSIENGHLDVNSALNNLSAALRKLEAAAEHLRK
jgi:hypothetical protein